MVALPSPIIQGHSVPTASQDAGAWRGSLKNYCPPRVLGRQHQAWEHALTNARVEDLFANDPTAHSGILSIATNVVGQGLKPQSVIPAERLGITDDQAKDVADQMEWLWLEWNAQAHYREQMSFDELQRLGLVSLIRFGEMLHLPIMEERDGSRFALRLQDISPQRLRTPFDKTFEPLIHNGVEVSRTGVPVAYWIASPEPTVAVYEDSMLSSDSYRRIPARVAHRPGIFHIFRSDSEESFRGVSCLAPAVKFFRLLNDSIDYELMAQVLSASFPVFIALQNGPQQVPNYVQDNGAQEPTERQYYQDVAPGQIMYGNEGEKPEILESNRPGNNFTDFCTLVMRMLASALEVPYEVLTKDYSKTNYSSARAALLEAWRVYEVYRAFFTRRYCEPVWGMVMEEAWLRGYLVLPEGAPDFYEARHLWCNTRWVGPARGYIDPTKETAANISAIQAGLMSRSEAIAERGSDVDDVARQLAREQELYSRLGVTLSAESGTNGGGNGNGNTENGSAGAAEGSSTD